MARFSTLLSCTAVAGGLCLAYGAARAEDRSGVRPEVLTLPTGPGSIAGFGSGFEANPSSGTPSYRIDINVPNGLAGTAPSLALEYSSGRGDSELGLGWSLNVPAIERAVERGLPSYDDTDAIALRGPSGGELTAVGQGVYRLRVEGAFARGHRDGADTWTFETRSGNVLTFGGDASAQVRDGDRVFSWLLASSADRYGHRIDYDYDTVDGRPYLARVRYGATEPGGTNEIVFAYEDRAEPTVSYQSTWRVATGRRLASIEVRSRNDLVRRYELGYETMLGLDRLVSVEIVGRDGVTALPALQFDYAAPVTDASAVVAIADAPARSLGQQVELDDVDGDGLTDLLVMDASLDGGAYSWYRNLDGTRFGPRQVMSSSPSAWLASSDVQLADMDGDGAADVVARLSSAADGLRYYPGGDPDGFGAAVVVSGNPSMGLDDPDVRLVDLDRDGLTDWMRIDPTTGAISVRMRNAAGGMGAPVTRPPLASGELLTFSGSGLRLADANGDGSVDIVHIRPGAARYFPAMGFGQFDDAVALPGVPALTDAQLAALQVRDLNGDGLADLVRVDSGRVHYWLNRAGASLETERTIDGTPELRPETVVRVADLNGNGSADIVWADPTAAAPWRYLDVVAEGTPGLMTRIDNGLGKVTTIAYAGLGDMRAWADDAGVEWTRRSAIGQMVVAEISVSDGIGPAMVTRMRYADAYFDGDRREFRGFARVVRHDAGGAGQPGLVTDQRYDVGETDEARRGLLLSSTTLAETGERFETRTLTYRVEALAPGVRVAEQQSEERAIYEGAAEPRIVRTEWEHDAYGNVTVERKLGEVGVDGDETVVERSYAVSEDPWIVDRVAVETVRNAGGDRVAETMTYYDGLDLGEVSRGTPTRVATWIEGDRYASETMELDAHGNVVARTDARGGRTELEYDETHTFATTIRRFPADGVALEWHATYDSGFGELVRVEEPDGTVTELSYDALGRIERVVSPGDTAELPTVRYAYNLGAPLSNVRTEQRLRSGEDDVGVSYTHVDGLGRTRASAQRSAGGQWIVTDWISYGTRGAVAFSAQPHYAASADYAVDPPAAGVARSYDPLGRVVSTLQPDGAEARVEYQPLAQVHTDENGTPTVRRVDGLGRLRATVAFDAGREVATVFEYDALGNITAAIDPLGNARRYEWDGRSEQIAVHDPDAGTWRQQFDDGGALIERVDGAGNTVRIARDALGRPTEEWHQRAGENDEQLAVTMHYDNPSPRYGALAHQRGRLSWVEDAAGEVHLGYDARGNLVDEVRVWDDGDEHYTWRELDAAGRLVRRGYPDGTYLPLSYDEAGRLRSAGGVVTALEYTAWGDVAQVRYGNGVTERFGYDVRRRVTTRVAESSQGTLRDLAYQYDAASFIAAITDRTPGIAASLDLTASYRYDDRYRLVEMTDAEATTRWSFDDGGKILSVESDHAAPFLNVANRYGEGGAGPSQLTSFGGERLRYDDAGRVVEDGERTLEWDARGRLARVVRGNLVEEYVYDYADRRVLKRTWIDGEESTVRYIAPDVEERDGELVRYVTIDGRRVARLDSAPPVEAPAVTASLELGAAGWSFALLLFPIGLVLVRRERRLALGLALMLGCGGSSGLVRGDEPVDEWPDEGVLYLADHLDSPTAFVGAGGDVQGRVSYYAYGAVRATDGLQDAFGYVGNELDRGSGLGAFGARPYRADAGVFLAGDPVAMRPRPDSAREASLFAYAYSEGSPIMRRDPDGRCSAPAGLAKGETGVCIEQFIASKRVGGIGFGDGRGFDGDDPSLTNRVRIDLRIDPKTGAVQVDRFVAKSAVLSKKLARQGTLSLTVNPIRTNMNGSTDYEIRSEAYNGFRDFPGAPKAGIDMDLEIRVHPDGVVDILPGSKRDGFPSYGIYSYREVNGTTVIDALHEGKETKIEKLGGSMDTDIPATHRHKDPSGGEQ